MNVIEKLKKYLKAEMRRLDEEYIEREKIYDDDIDYLKELEYKFAQTEKILKKLEELEDEGE